MTTYAVAVPGVLFFFFVGYWAGYQIRMLQHVVEAA